MISHRGTENTAVFSHKKRKKHEGKKLIKFAGKI
jgi:hypothetical protein